jgi:hypothetical protein
MCHRALRLRAEHCIRAVLQRNEPSGLQVCRPEIEADIFQENTNVLLPLRCFLRGYYAVWNCSYVCHLREHHIGQDKQCTYNVTQRRVRATIVAVEKKGVLRNLCVCFVALVMQHAPYCHLWPARSSTVLHIIS